jgi:hypothetical protein
MAFLTTRLTVKKTVVFGGRDIPFEVANGKTHDKDGRYRHDDEQSGAIPIKQFHSIPILCLINHSKHTRP